jgi:hypothetical protein
MMSRAIYALAGLLTGAIVDVLVSLLAAGIQQRAFPGQLSTQALWILAVLAVLGLLAGYWLGGKLEIPASSSPSPSSSSTAPAPAVLADDKVDIVKITRLRALLSYSKLKGKGIHLSDIFLVGSRIDIEN